MPDDSFKEIFQKNFPDLYAEGRKADDELGDIAHRLAQVAKEIIVSHNKIKPPDMAARLTADLQACIDSATSWIKFSYTLPETLANEYGKTCFGSEEAKGKLGLVSWAAALSEPQVAAALKQAYGGHRPGGSIPCFPVVLHAAWPRWPDRGGKGPRPT